jgi:D-tyrosyl-tRNA(Tyr) deacylase
MRAVIQRVKRAEVIINSVEKRRISQGLLILLGIEENDNQEDVEWLATKISKLRIFDDENDVMNLDINDINVEAMIISQFTLHAKTKKGNRPSYIKAAKPDIAIPIYEKFIEEFEFLLSKKIAIGEFGAHMDIELINDGPVTIIIDTKNKE